MRPEGTRVFLAHVGPRGRALVDKRLWLPQAWSDDPARCATAGVPEEARAYQSTAQRAPELALALLRRAKALDQLAAEWVTGDDAYGSSPEFRDGVAAEGFRFMLEVPGTTPVWPVVCVFETPPYAGRGRPPEPRPELAQRREARERADTLPPHAWQEVYVADGTQGPRVYRFAAERVRETRDRRPGEVYWLVHRQNLDGSEARYFFSNAPEATPLPRLSRVAAARWPIETEFETDKSDVGLDEYEVRGWHGWNHHRPEGTRPLLAGFCLPADASAGMGGERCPRSPGRRSIGRCARVCRGSASPPSNCWRGCWTPTSAMNVRSSPISGGARGAT